MDCLKKSTSHEGQMIGDIPSLNWQNDSCTCGSMYIPALRNDTSLGEDPRPLDASKEVQEAGGEGNHTYTLAPFPWNSKLSYGREADAASKINDLSVLNVEVDLPTALQRTRKH